MITAPSRAWEVVGSMSSSNISWDVQDQNDRIISILAWVVVVVLVLYASVYFYKQVYAFDGRAGTVAGAAGRGRRPVRHTVGPVQTAGVIDPEADARRDAMASPPSLTVERPLRAPPHELAVHAVTDVGAASPRVAAPRREYAPAPIASAAAVLEDGAPASPRSARWSVRIGEAAPTAREAQRLLLKLPLVLQDIRFVQTPAGWAIHVGQFRTQDEAVSLARKAARYGASVAIVEPGGTLAPASGIETAGGRPAVRVAARGAPVTSQSRTRRLARAVATARRPAAAARTVRPAPARGSAEAASEAVAGDESAEDGSPAIGSEQEAVLRAPDVRSLAVTGARRGGERGPQRRPPAAAAREDGARAAVDAGAETGTGAPPDEARPASYSLQVGAFSTEQKAREVASDLRQKGHAARIDESSSGDETLYRVRVGSYLDGRQAHAAARRVSGELGFSEVRVIKD
jgi:cell division septation protein DedD